MPSAIYTNVKGDITPTRGTVLVINMENGERLSRGGIIITDDNGEHRGIRARWAQVYKVGEGITTISEGDWIYVDHGRWTFGINLEISEDETVYLQKVDPSAILIRSETNPLEV
jgi:hypothetical protein